MKTIIFSPVTTTLSEPQRMISIARAIGDRFGALFTSYGGAFEQSILDEGFAVERLEPQFTPERLLNFQMVSDEKKPGGYFYPVEDVRAQVRNEIALYKRVKPAAVVTGFNFSNNISCRAAGVPLVWVSQSTWHWRSMMAHGLTSYPDPLDRAPLRWLPERWATRLMLAAFPFLVDRLVRPYDRVSKEYGLPPGRKLDWLWTGDHNLLAEPEGFSGLPMPAGYRYIGPLLSHRDGPVPPEVRDMPRDRPVVLFTMGSIGMPEMEVRIIEAFEGRPYGVIAPMKQHFEGMPVRVPENVLLTDFLPPAYMNNAGADVMVTHGGIGSVMTACLSGTPVVGVHMQHENQANLDCLARKGFGIGIRKTRLTIPGLFGAIDRMADPAAKRKAMEYSKVVREWDDPGRVKAFFEETFG